jgi:hypothetical protein
VRLDAARVLHYEGAQAFFVTHSVPKKARETRSIGHAGRVADSGYASGFRALDSTVFPAPPARAPGLRPPLRHRRPRGRLVLGDDTLCLPVPGLRLPPPYADPTGWDAASGAARWTHEPRFAIATRLLENPAYGSHASRSEYRDSRPRTRVQKAMHRAICAAVKSMARAQRTARPTPSRLP